VYRDKMRGCRQHLDGECIERRHREHRADGERVAGAIYPRNADVIPAGALRAGKGGEVEAGGVWGGKPTKPGESEIARGDDAGPALVSRLLRRAVIGERNVLSVGHGRPRSTAPDRGDKQELTGRTQGDPRRSREGLV